MPHSRKRSLNILVADDEPSVCTAYRMILRHCGHSVEVVHNGQAALDLLEAKPFDLVITDYQMPDMKGDELTATIKLRLPNQRIIMVTAFAESFLASQTPMSDPDYILSKPFKIEELRAAIDKVMG